MLQSVAEAVFKHPDRHCGIIQGLKLHMKFFFGARDLHRQESVPFNRAQSIRDKPAVGIPQLDLFHLEAFVKQSVNQPDHGTFGQTEQRTHYVIQPDLLPFCPFFPFSAMHYPSLLYHTSEPGPDGPGFSVQQKSANRSRKGSNQRMLCVFVYACGKHNILAGQLSRSGGYTILIPGFTSPAPTGKTSHRI